MGSDYVRGPKFALYEIGLLSNFDIGYYAVIANVSDIAAMGALPMGVLTIVRYPNEMDDTAFEEIMAGIHKAATECGTLNIGGDIGQAERIILAGTAFGVCQQGNVLTRSGAQTNDLLCVTGPCGVLGAAVAYFPKRKERGWHIDPNTEEELLAAWRRPRARIAEGLLLATKPLASACQDTSDGLKATIEQLADASGVDFEVSAESIPIHKAVREVADLVGIDALALALSASADFHLAFTVNPDNLEACKFAFASSGLELAVIGRAVEKCSGSYLLSAQGERLDLPGVAWRHQTRDIGTLVADTMRSGKPE
jgi:thiamine-monophosphate kinase